VTVPCEFGLEGHSDADVLAHAITDAILGAAALGDIGMHFPRYRPAMEGLRQPGVSAPRPELAEARGYRIVNVDSTVILERPKLKDYRLPIRERWRGAAFARARRRFGEVQDRGKSRAGG
jgi:2-C-methyl-D-erythritol 2,4-cyclodiphosphate synthase